MEKKKVYAIAAGAGLAAATGIAVMRKTQAVRHARRAYHGMMDFKNEFAGELSQMARRAGRTMIKVGSSLDKMSR